MIAPRLVPRAEPLAPAAFEARGEAARAWVRRYLHRQHRVAPLGVRHEDSIVVVGDELPWSEGLRWLGKEPDAPALLVPTRLGLAPHPALVSAALTRAREASEFPLVLLPSGSERIEVIALGMARPLSESALHRFLGGAADE